MENLEFKGTKEDWLLDSTDKSIEKYPNHLQIVTESGKQIALVNHSIGEMDASEYIANAKLIGASKNLLKVLQKILSYDLEEIYPGFNEDTGILKEIEKALK